MGAAEGNPLFVEEMLGMLIDDGLLTRKNGDWIAAGDLSASRSRRRSRHCLARLDRLGRRAAVIERGPSRARSSIAALWPSLATNELRDSVWNHLRALGPKGADPPTPDGPARRRRLPGSGTCSSGTPPARKHAERAPC